VQATPSAVMISAITSKERDLCVGLGPTRVSRRRVHRAGEIKAVAPGVNLMRALKDS
jgi:hypothetical protein